MDVPGEPPFSMMAQGLHSPRGIVVRNEDMSAELQKLWKTEDYRAVWLGLGIVLLALVAFYSGSTVASWAVTPGSWSDVSAFGADLAKILSTVVFSKYWSNISKMMRGHSEFVLIRN
jgi:hypothetical protein